MTQAEREANEALWAQRVAEYQASGLSQPQWAAAHGVPLRRLKYWLHKFRAAAMAPAPTWVACAGPDPAPALTVRVGAVEICVERDFDPPWLQAVVRALTS
ncbi:MAG: IS66 family insertion sequence element accessory protein TnpB [Firmicutes bacterium]|nr:IS66 family insertion sequence element accessory protein TnpB [Bacillota bacterium]